MSQFRQFFLFTLTGTVGFLVDSVLLYILAGGLGWYGARVASFAAAATTTWIINRKFTFAQKTNKNQPISTEYIRYITSMLGGAAVNFSIYTVIIKNLTTPYAPLIGVAAGSIGGMFCNYFSAKYIVFKTKTQTSDI